MPVAAKCKVCAEKNSSYFSVSDKVIGKDLSTAIENIIGIKICPVKSSNNILICQDCALSVIQAETFVDKLRRSFANLSKKKAIKEKDKTQEPDKLKQQNAQSIQAPIKGNGSTIRNFKCDHCPYESVDAKDFKKHLANNHQIEKSRIYKCNQCSESYQLLHRLESHVKFVHEEKTRPPPRRRNSTFPSEISNTLTKEKDSESDKDNGSQETEAKKEHKQNMDISLDNLHFKCDHCSYTSDNAKLFKRHLKNKHQIEKPRIFKCSQCSESYLLLYGLQSHIKYVHENAPRPPRRRNSVFPSELKKTVSEEDDAVTPSNECKNSEELSQSLVEDTEQEKNKEILKADTANSFEASNMVNSKGDRLFKCDHCPYESGNAEFYKKHLTSKHQIEKPRIFKCNQCSETYQLLYGLEHHIKRVHENKSTLFPKFRSDLPVETNVTTDYISFKLPVSKKNKSHNSTLSQQENPVENVETYIEPEKTEVGANIKLSIKRTKSKATKYINNETLASDEQVSSSPPLKKTKYTGPSEQVTPAPNANRSGSENDNGDNQEYTPKKTSENDSFSISLYECNDCSYNSYNAKHFKKHILSKHQINDSSIHTDISNIKSPYPLVSRRSKPHVCVVCGKKFALIDELRLHTDNCHLGEVVKECPHCGAIFRSEQKYEVHVFSEKCLTAKYSCQYPNCNKRFSKSSKLHKHMQEKHPDEQIL